MCVIMYKPSGVKAPSKADFKKCFKTNPHGCGYMIPLNGKVVLRKGFMKFADFEKDIKNFVRDNNIDPIKTPIVCHFRISTQGGVNQALCHPYPVCSDYESMRKLNNTCDIAMAHNGIISLTSEYHYYKPKDYVAPNYNDTMTFIKDYASLIINGDMYFARKDNKCKLLETLVGNYNKLCFMTGKGYVKMIGKFYDRNGVYYSNLNAFAERKMKHISTYMSDYLHKQVA